MQSGRPMAGTRYCASSYHPVMGIPSSCDAEALKVGEDVNVLWSATVASVIPMVLRRFRIDPAVVSAPFIATLVDGAGLIIYFQEDSQADLPDLQVGKHKETKGSHRLPFA